MDFKELQTKEIKELQQLLAANREKLRELRFKNSNQQLKNVREIRSLRQTIAHLLTTLNKKK
ncbi:50S ribosomal protein L29 [Candidatus Falkowbacteria bacterium]|uniref:Large ribosomal subunit protein uL29 n=1 Tax=Candidatus Falkowbacteria bacterium CG10_big_fil_rev_8_21_14_0_10_37_18 TaxID=1974562 RepID=A0A2H0V8T3_9BACT|nr:50S ribosomal protein L29 [Candidatus Falkowbacteria bacterium]NCQ12538.1 50S ribosomal protein L29 [Candidatus Falkowbacteria bacterium]OIO06002.1 MAG: 50S ribosomal protein L29 [Candidatus Falkowbacteria bacterium CG1_02_37_21]PIR95524.1 MAG: 50S ribosomal protein L29 [Candidatus Falkowbacteria bacterium CG10_big_fil_rev_8_21_14_0_10_37_18]